MSKVVSSLFVSPWESNPGFAISLYEKMCARAGIELAGGDPARVHFAFSSLAGGPPRNLPDGVVTFPSAFARTAASEGELSDYVRDRGIELVQLLDFNITDPLTAKLRKVGARTMVSYWGAPISGPQPRWKYLLKRFHVALSRSRLDGLIFESQAMARRATHDRGVPASLVDVASVLGVDGDFLNATHSEYVYDRLAFPRHRRIIVFAGHVIRRKGIHILVEAAVELLEGRQRKDVAFLICGDRDGDREQFEPIYAGKGLDDLIRFGGYRSDIKDIFSSAFCGVIPSTGWESFTLTSLEMAGCGLPIVASRLDGLVEAVIDGKTGILFTPGDPNALTDALERLLDYPERAAELGRNGRDRCAAEFTLDRQFGRYLAVLQRRLDERDKRTRN
jgi:glycosyltransferase involved in cell wall biosynthesis